MGILSGGDAGKEELERIVKGIIAQMNEEAYEDSYEDSGDDFDDDGDTAVAGSDTADVLGTLDVPKPNRGQEYDVDDILDKIGRGGMSSLTKEELQFLRNHSKS